MAIKQTSHIAQSTSFCTSMYGTNSPANLKANVSTKSYGATNASSSYADNITESNETTSITNNFFEPDEEVVVEEEEELGHAETYANYMPSKCNIYFLFLFIFIFLGGLIF